MSSQLPSGVVQGKLSVIGNGVVLDPRAGGEPFSPSRVQDLASCPFSCFVRHVLRVEAPEDMESDPTRWLDPMSEGSLLHEVFRDFFEKITAAGGSASSSRC